MSGSNWSKHPGALGKGMYSVGSPERRHGWSGDWHLQPRKRLDGPAESFAIERRHGGPRRQIRQTPENADGL